MDTRVAEDPFTVKWRQTQSIPFFRGVETKVRIWGEGACFKLNFVLLMLSMLRLALRDRIGRTHSEMPILPPYILESRNAVLTS